MQHYISFSVQTSWFSVCIYYKMTTTVVWLTFFTKHSYRIFFPPCNEKLRFILSNFQVCNTVLTSVTVLSWKSLFKTLLSVGVIKKKGAGAWIMKNGLSHDRISLKWPGVLSLGERGFCFLIILFLLKLPTWNLWLTRYPLDWL